jgi:hypothetical protein
MEDFFWWGQILIFRCRNVLCSRGAGSVLSLGSIGVFIVAERSFLDAITPVNPRFAAYIIRILLTIFASNP